MQTTPIPIRPFRSMTILALLAGLGPIGTLYSQPNKQGPEYPSPRVLLLTPSGGKAGTTVEVQVTGQDIEAPQGLLFSQPRIKAELIDVGTGKIETGKRGQPKVTTTVARWKVAIPADVPTGFVDLRLVNGWGVSNPRTFVVGDQTDVLEKEPNNDIEQAQRVEINTTINGTLGSPTDVDYFVFSGKKGQRVVVSCLASSIDSKAEPALQLFNKGGVMLNSNRDYQGKDALLDRVLTEDGDYYVRLFSFTYTQGGSEHFYRLTITTAPWIDAVFPRILNPGKDNTVSVWGRNLPGGKLDPNVREGGSALEKLTVTIKAPADPVALQRLNYPGFIAPRSSELDGLTYQLSNASGQSNPYLLLIGKAPVVADNGDNETPDKAQKVQVPCDISGWIERLRDRDWYSFEAKKGETHVIEVMGERLGSPMDMYFSLRPADGKGNPTEYDDNPDILHPQQFYTRNEDPQRLRFTAPADGRYLLQVSSRDADLQASPRLQYRVRITPEMPDFRLIVMPPETKNPMGEVVQAGSAQAWTVLVWRQDGFDGPITLSMDGLPPGVTCPPQYIGHGQREEALAVVASPDAKAWTGVVSVKGTAEIDGKAVVREARPATITWPTNAQQNQKIPAVSRLDHSLVLAVRQAQPLRIKAVPDTIKVLAGEKTTINLAVEKLSPDFKGPISLTLPNVPQTVMTFNNNQPLKITDGKKGSAVLDIKSAVQPGNYTVVLHAQTQVSFSKDAASKTKSNVNTYAVVLPITVTVLSKNAGTVGGVLVLSPSEVTIQKGKTADIAVKLNRPANLTGEVKVEVVIPKGVAGVHGEGTVIPSGKKSGRVVIRVDSNTNSGPRNLTVRLSGQSASKTPVSSEAKLTVTVVRPPK